ncbi:MAG: hypothetical protein COA79_11570 [Planctomycetota bacterium]|nr:MAG: hypothetical protein COA79_11570 [Planctomycetota bacterium]
MKWIILIIFQILLMNVHFLIAKYVSIFELHPIPLLVLAVFFILKADEKSIYISLLITGIITDIFYGRSIGPFTGLYLVSAVLLINSRDMLFKDHFMTHAIFVFIISMIGVFILYAIHGVVSLRAPIFIALYNTLLTPFLYHLFNQLKLHKLVSMG